MITTIRLVNSSITSQSYFFGCVCVVRTFKIYSMRSLYINDTVAPLLPTGGTFQGTKWLLKTADSTEPNICYDCSYTYIHPYDEVKL